ncbi:hypothetical protein BD410DRAFT_831519 [Rickenella mellea]|uniref:Uncharacterized protein n=1 Tax=Rickenella mellea TaxID=50990 RepID=A0A4Y7PR95_9AGAM|nr:hypothetical protein BD410DRAFT_831519 [Rickenella mellea]
MTYAGPASGHEKLQSLALHLIPSSCHWDGGHCDLSEHGSTMSGALVTLSDLKGTDSPAHEYPVGIEDARNLSGYKKPKLSPSDIATSADLAFGGDSDSERRTDTDSAISVTSETLAEGEEAYDFRSAFDPPWLPFVKGTYSSDVSDDHIHKLEQLPGLFLLLGVDPIATIEDHFPSNPRSPTPSEYYEEVFNSAEGHYERVFPALVWSVSVGVASPKKVELQFFFLEHDDQPRPVTAYPLVEPVVSRQHSDANNGVNDAPQDQTSNLRLRVSQCKRLTFQLSSLIQRCDSLIGGPKMTEQEMEQLNLFQCSNTDLADDWQSDDGSAHNTSPMPVEPPIFRMLNSFHGELLPWAALANYPHVSWGAYPEFSRERELLRRKLLDIFADHEVYTIHNHALTSEEDHVEQSSVQSIIPFEHPDKGSILDDELTTWTLSSIFQLPAMQRHLDANVLSNVSLCSRNLSLTMRRLLYRSLRLTVNSENSATVSRRLQGLADLLSQNEELAIALETVTFVIDAGLVGSLKTLLGLSSRSFYSLIKRLHWPVMDVEIVCSSKPLPSSLRLQSPMFQYVAKCIRECFGAEEVVPPFSTKGVAFMEEWERQMFEDKLKYFEKQRSWNEMDDEADEVFQISCELGGYVDLFEKQERELSWAMTETNIWLNDMDESYERSIRVNFLWNGAYVHSDI